MKAETQTAAEKISKTEKIKEIEIKIARAIELEKKIEPLKKELEGIKVYFKDEIFSGSKSEERIVTTSGAVTLKLTDGYSIAPKSIPDLKTIFGELYKGMVNEKTSYGVSAAFKKLLLDADYKQHDAIRKAVIIKTTPSVSFDESLQKLKLVKS